MDKPEGKIKPFLKRYAISVIFPVCAAFFIYADLKHTREWKARVALESQQKEKA